MNFLGYLVTLANMKSISGGSPNDMSIRVGTLQSIADEVRSLPIPLDSFRQNGYQRKGPIGIYLSKNVQNYLFYNQGNANDEGMMLSLFFDEKSQGADEANPQRQTLFIHRQPVSDEVQNVINSYAQTGRWPHQTQANFMLKDEKV